MSHQEPASNQGVQSRNGFGTAGFVLGLLATIFGFLPIFGLISLPLGILGIVFGILGYRRKRYGTATNGGLALAGAILGIIGVILSIFSMIALGTAARHIDEQMNRPEMERFRELPGYGSMMEPSQGLDWSPR